MLPDQITLAVDTEGDGLAVVNEVYDRYDVYQNRSVYIEAGHALTARHMMNFYRTLPKSNGNFLGVAKTAAKFTVDRVVLGVDGSNIVAPEIWEVSCSLPLGVSAAQSLWGRERAAALLHLTGVMADLNDKQEI